MNPWLEADPRQLTAAGLRMRDKAIIANPNVAPVWRELGRTCDKYRNFYRMSENGTETVRVTV